MKAILTGGQKNRGGQGNMQQMLQQVQKAQEDMEVLQEELNEREYTAQAGGGVVFATVNGKHRLLKLEIKPEIIDPDDAEMLGDLVMAAINEAIREAEEATEKEMANVTDGLPAMPGMF